MAELITANDLHEAADDPRMLPEGRVPEGMTETQAIEALGVEPYAIRDFLASADFRFPTSAGLPANLDLRSIAYGICLGLTAKLRQERGDS